MLTYHGNIEKYIINLTRRRLIANCINMLVSPFFIFGPIFLLMYIMDIKEFQYENLIALLLSIILFTFAFLIQFGIFVVLTNGYTVGGFIMRLKIVRLDGEKLKLWSTLQRFLAAWNQINKFFFFSHTKVNTLGQFYYDVKFNTTVINSKDNIQKVSDIKNLEYNYTKEFLIVFILLFSISNLMNWVLK